MRAPFRIFLVIVSFGLSQAWAFEGFHELWGKKEKKEEPAADVNKLQKEHQTQVSELKQIEAQYFMMRDEVKSLLPNLIGAIEGKGAGERLTSEDITHLCSDLKKDLRVPDACVGYVKRRAFTAKEDLITFMEARELKLKEIYPRYKAIRDHVAALTEKLQNAESGD